VGAKNGALTQGLSRLARLRHALEDLVAAVLVLLSQALAQQLRRSLRIQKFRKKFRKIPGRPVRQEKLAKP